MSEVSDSQTCKPRMSAPPRDTADLAGLAVRDKFDLALVLEKQKAVLVRQGLVGFKKTDDLLLFLFG